MQVVATSAFLLTLLAVAPAQAADERELSPAPGHRVVSVTPDPGAFNGPSIAINPANAKQIVVAFGSRVTVDYSTDAGAHWATSQGTAPTNYRATGDISITYDRQGHAILCFIAFDAAGSWR